MKKNSNSKAANEKPARLCKAAKARPPIQRDAKEVMGELVAKLSEKLAAKPATANAAEERPENELGPNRDRLTVGVDLGDTWSNYCILDLDGEKVMEGELKTTRQDFAEFFQALSAARVVIEWVRIRRGYAMQ